MWKLASGLSSDAQMIGGPAAPVQYFGRDPCNNENRHFPRAASRMGSGVELPDSLARLCHTTVVFL